MASKWKRPPNPITSSILDDDLRLSSDEEESSLVYNEEDLLYDGDEISMDKESKEDKSSQLDTNTSNGNSKEAVRTGVTTGELNDKTPSGTNVTMMRMRRELAPSSKGKEEPDYRNMDLDEVCRRRNILPPPKMLRNNHRFHYNGAITGARGKFYNIDPRQNLSLDEIIKSIPSLGRENQPFRRRPHVSQIKNAQQDDKLRRGLEKITENHPTATRGFRRVADSFNAPELTPDPWYCVLNLINEGYNIEWVLMERKNSYNLSEDDKSRLHRCTIAYRNVSGCCEAGSALLAKNGAALNFMEKMGKEFPLLSLGKSLKMTEALLLEPNFFSKFFVKLQQSHGTGTKVHSNFQVDTVNNRVFHRCKLTVGTSQFEGYSHLNPTFAKLMATKAAYESLFKEPCPTQKIHVGIENCSRDASLYFDKSSETFACFDFTQVNVVDSAKVRTTLCNYRKGHHSIFVSNLGPATVKCY